MNTTQTIVLFVIIAALLAFRIYRQTREQRWKIQTMWIVPIIFLVLTGLIVGVDTTQVVFAPLAAVVGLAIGFFIGLYQGNHTTLRIDKANKAVYVKVKPLGTLIFMTIIVARIAFRIVTIGPIDPSTPPSAVPPTTPVEAVISGLLLALAAGTILGLRWYVHRRYDAEPTAVLTSQ